MKINSEYRIWIGAGLIMFPLQIIDIMLPQAFVLSVVIVVFGVLCYISIETNDKYFKPIFICLAAFVFFELLVFPIIFSSLLSSANSKHYRISADVNDLRKSDAIHELNSEIDTTINAIFVKTIDSILLDSIQTITDAKCLDSQNILYAGGYAIYKACIPISGRGHPAYGHSVFVCDNKGSKLLQLPDNVRSFETIRDFFIKIREDKVADIVRYKATRYNFEKNIGIWSYKDCILYAVSNSKDDLFIPLSKFANLTNTINDMVFYLLSSIFIAFVTIPLPKVINAK